MLCQHNNLGCSSWESHTGGPLLTMCMWGLFYTFWWACCAGEQPSWAATCLEWFPPKCPKIHQCQPAAPLLGDHLCQAAAACQSFELSLEKVLTISAEYSPGGVGSAQAAHIWLAQVHPSVQIPFKSKLRYPTFPVHHGFICYQRCKVQSLKQRHSQCAHVVYCPAEVLPNLLP